MSVVVPAYNGERFLGAALDSALAQDYHRLELIVVDDGSTDATGEIARSRPVRYISRVRRGVAEARNTGVAAARGELVAFLDQDDIWLPGKVSRQVARLHDEPDVGIVGALMEIFLEAGTPRPAWFKPAWELAPQASWLFSTLLIRRELFTSVGPLRYGRACDFDWLLRARRAGVRSALVREPLVRYRVHGGNETHDRAAGRDTLFRVLRASTAARRAEGEAVGGRG